MEAHARTHVREGIDVRVFTESFGYWLSKHLDMSNGKRNCAINPQSTGGVAHG